MVCTFYSGSDTGRIRLLLLLLPAVLLVASCASTNSGTSNRSDDVINEYRSTYDQPAGPITVQDDDTDAEAEAGNNEFIRLDFHSDQYSVTINLDPSEAFRVRIPGVKPSEERGEDNGEGGETLENDRIQQVMRHFRRAQDFFYSEQYNRAMESVDAALAIQETAEALGLKGTIYLMLDNTPAARRYWQRAVENDPDIPVPAIPEIEGFIQEIDDET